MGTQRRTFTEAAHALGISTEAVRMRVRRGTLRSERDGDGNVKVLIDADQVRSDETNNELVSVLREQLEYLREENRRKDHLLAALIQKVPALQGAAEERRDVNASHDDPAGGYSGTGSREGPQTQSSWWKRIFWK